uniref:EGF-like domain-containing protein n=1 Tax=Nelumbo nucifera TaxID=4432 RepID=A0A822ZBG2_NELNU|nr:TPA_asm: hypothetical protein HUJ06_000692 [Nelumbo nucifera]
MIEYGLATTAEKFLLLICFTPWYLPHHFCKPGRIARNGGAQRPTLQFISLSLLLVLLKDEVAAASSSLALPGCQDKCGNVSIPYPFGIGSNCSKNSSFEVSCDSTAAAGYTPTISIGLPPASEVVEILPENKVKIITDRLWLFNASENESNYFLNLIGTPFYLSQDRNVFTTVGCDILGYMISGGIRVGGCLSTCIFMSGTVEVNKRVRIAPTGCNGGYGCCQTSILPLLQYLELQSSRETALNDTAYAFIADKEWLGNDFNVTAYRENPTAERPVVLDWVIGNGTCETANPSSNCGPNSYCRNVTSGDGYACFCNRGYEGNPYLRQGCHDIDECADTKTNDCGWTCVNGPGNYSCSCPPGYHGDGKKIGVGCMKENEVERYIPWVIDGTNCYYFEWAEGNK